MKRTTREIYWTWPVARERREEEGPEQNTTQLVAMACQGSGHRVTLGIQCSLAPKLVSSGKSVVPLVAMKEEKILGAKKRCLLPSVVHMRGVRLWHSMINR